MGECRGGPNEETAAEIPEDYGPMRQVSRVLGLAAGS